MAGNLYLQGIINKYINRSGAVEAAQNLSSIIKKWANIYFVDMQFSGSLAKGTSISLSADADIFISVAYNTPDTLQMIYETLYNAVFSAGYYGATKQNVSIGVNANGYKIDLVPGKRQSFFGNDHSLYKSKTGKWTKTNINSHISYVKNSNRISEIKLTKIWRELHHLDFPSFYLEMVVIDALKNCRVGNLASNFLKVLNFLEHNLTIRRFVDPANSNNIISDDLSASEKKLISQKAKISRSQMYWANIVW